VTLAVNINLLLKKQFRECACACDGRLAQHESGKAIEMSTSLTGLLWLLSATVSASSAHARRAVLLFCNLSPFPSKKLTCKQLDGFRRQTNPINVGHPQVSADDLKQGFPTLLLPCTPSAFRQMNMCPFIISTEKYEPLQHFHRCTCTPKISYDNTFYHDYSLIYLTISI